MKKILVIVVLVAGLLLPTMAQSYESQKQHSVAAPAAGFRSTSVMSGSGSTYSSTPSLESNGTAAAPAAKAPGGPHRAVDPISDGVDEQWYEDNLNVTGSDMPLGDAVLPLMLLAGAYFIVRAARRRKQA